MAQVPVSMKLGLLDLPTEILISVLASFRTHDLLPLTLVSHAFHNIILRILHFRLLVAAESPAHRIILEAYLPSRRWTRPYMFCTYLGTDGLSGEIEGEGSLYKDCHGVGDRLGRLSGLYSRFRPEFPGIEGSMPVRRIAGAAPNLQSNTSGLQMEWRSAPGFDSNSSQSTAASNSGTGQIAAQDAGQPQSPATASSQSQGQIPATQPIWANAGDGGSKKIIYTLNLDGEEFFGQFCVTSSLVRLGPRRGVFLSTVPIVQDQRGVIRVYRSKLLERATALLEEGRRGSSEQLKRTPTDLRPEDIVRDPSILWTDSQKNVGLRVIIRERPIAGIEPRGPDENKDDIPLGFDIEIKELLLRTTHLMLAIEESEELQKTPGKALIFGTFASAVN